MPAPHPIQSTPESDPEIKRVAAIVDRLDPHQNGGWAMKVGQFASMYPPAWILAACEAAAAAGKGDWRYVHKILQRYQAQGGPDAPPSPAGGRSRSLNASHKPTPMPEYYEGNRKRKAADQ